MDLWGNNDNVTVSGTCHYQWHYCNWKRDNIY